MSTPPPEPPSAAASTPRRFLTVPQVADELNVSVAQVYAMLRDRSLAAIKVGGRGQWRVERDRLEDYIARAYRDAETTDPADLPSDQTTD